jgi:hypothetical protein
MSEDIPNLSAFNKIVGNDKSLVLRPSSGHSLVARKAE